MRYIGQAFEVPVALGEDEIATLDEASLRERFNEAHHRIFEFDDTSTAYVPPGWRARVDAHHNIILGSRIGGGKDWRIGGGKD